MQKPDLFLVYLLTELTYWRQFHCMFIILYVSPASCSFMLHLGVDLGLGLTLPGLDLDLTVLWSN